MNIEIDILLFSYFLLYLIILSNYIIYVLILKRFEKNIKKIHHPNAVKSFSILIPFYNEEDYIEKKIKNLKEIIFYKLKCEVFFIDASSTDRSLKILEEAIKPYGFCKILNSPIPGKIQQLNFALDKINPSHSIVINTDMDTHISEGSIENILKILEDDNVGVVGASVMPKNGLPIDKIFWTEQNRIRVLESSYYSSSSVIAPLYGFKKEILTFFPENCVADDVYISFLANSKGLRVVYTKDSNAFELRAPSNLKNFITHKFRKAHGNMVETLRFLPSIKNTHRRWKYIFLNRACQIFIAPFLSVTFVSFSLYYVYSLKTFPMLVVATFFIISVLGLKTIKRFAPSGLKQEEFVKHSIILNFTLLLLTNIILIFSSISYLFKNKESKYKKTS
jgi:cellulose synthase/poly-beta-1,6-N-acetylglucosamine synthase-like glycosyltransferase